MKPEQGTVSSSVPYTVVDSVEGSFALFNNQTLTKLSVNQINDCYKPVFLDDTFNEGLNCLPLFKLVH